MEGPRVWEVLNKASRLHATEYMTVMNDVLTVLRAVGLDGVTATRGFYVLVSYTVGSVVV